MQQIFVLQSNVKGGVVDESRMAGRGGGGGAVHEFVTDASGLAGARTAVQ